MAGLWHKTLVYFGLADEEDDYYDEEVPAQQQPDLESTYRQRANVRRIESTSKRRGASDFDDIYSDDDYRSARPSSMSTRTSPVRPVPSASDQQPVRVHLVVPKNFNDAQIVADKVFLLTPKNVEVSAEERQRLLEKGFFNQY